MTKVIPLFCLYAAQLNLPIWEVGEEMDRLNELYEEESGAYTLK